MFGLIPFENRNNSFDDMFHALDQMERGFFGNLNGSVSQFRTDIQDKGDHYLLEAELPGFSKEDLAIDLNRNYLTISAKREENSDKSDLNFVRKERKVGYFSRSFDVSGIDTSAIKAAYQNGILSLELPKLPESHQNGRVIEIQ